MKIVITGALGHIGSRLIRDLPSEFGTNPQGQFPQMRFIMQPLQGNSFGESLK